jgi:hypothetical protein
MCLFPLLSLDGGKHVSLPLCFRPLLSLSHMGGDGVAHMRVSVYHTSQVEYRKLKRDYCFLLVT